MSYATSTRQAARVLLAAVIAVPCSAQGVVSATIRSAPLHGFVSTIDGVGLGGATVTALLPGAELRSVTVSSGDDGSFLFADLPSGHLRLQIRRIGFAAETLSVEVPSVSSHIVAVRLRRMDRLPTIVVRAKPSYQIGPFAGFYHRAESGQGHFVTRADIERRRPIHTTDLLRMVPGLQLQRDDNEGNGATIRFRGSTCDPSVWVDGTPLGPANFNFDALPPSSIEGIEVYSGVATTPAEFRSERGHEGCGAIGVWTRHGERRPRSLARDTKPITSAGIAELVEAATVFTAEDVDSVAVPDEDIGAALRYPPSLATERLRPVQGLVEFVVDTLGTVEDATLNFVAPMRREFADAVRSVLPEIHFSPARRAGRLVRQLVQLPLRFDPPLTDLKEAQRMLSP